MGSFENFTFSTFFMIVSSNSRSGIELSPFGRVIHLLTFLIVYESSSIKNFRCSFYVSVMSCFLKLVVFRYIFVVQVVNLNVTFKKKMDSGRISVRESVLLQLFLFRLFDALEGRSLEIEFMSCILPLYTDLSPVFLAVESFCLAIVAMFV